MMATILGSIGCVLIMTSHPPNSFVLNAMGQKSKLYFERAGVLGNQVVKKTSGREVGAFSF
jgi:hypothetical protein